MLVICQFITVTLPPTPISSKRDFKQKDKLKGIHLYPRKTCFFTSGQFLDLPEHHTADTQHWVLAHSALNPALFRDLWQ